MNSELQGALANQVEQQPRFPGLTDLHYKSVLGRPHWPTICI